MVLGFAQSHVVFGGNAPPYRFIITIMPKEELVKAKNTTLTAAIVLAMGTTTASQASLDTNDNLLIDIASGNLIKEGQQIPTQQRFDKENKIVVAKAATKKKAAPKRKAATK
jgi:hypothetical protein